MPPDAYLTAFEQAEEGLAVQTNTGQIAVVARGTGTPTLIQRAVVDSPVLLPGNRLAMIGASGDSQTARLVILQNGEEQEVVLPDAQVRSERNQLIYDNRENRLYMLLGAHNDASSLYSINLNPNAAFETTRLPGNNDIAIALNKRGDVVRFACRRRYL